MNVVSQPSSKEFILDITERAIVAVFYGAFVFAIFQSLIGSGSPIYFLLLVSEGSVVVFILVRRFTLQVSQRPMDWIAGLIGTTAPLLVRPVEDANLAPIAVCSILMLLGLSLSLAAKLILRRSFGVVAANRGVKASGPYRLVRHPMYAGYLLTQLGFLLGNPSLWNASIYLIGFAFQLRRILAEERILGADPIYTEFASTVRYRLLPGVY